MAIEKLSLEEIIACHSRRINVDRDLYMDYLVDEQPQLLEFMYELKSVFGKVLMPKLSQPHKNKTPQFESLINEYGYLQGFIPASAVKIDPRYADHVDSQNPVHRLKGKIDDTNNAITKHEGNSNRTDYSAGN